MPPRKTKTAVAEDKPKRCPPGERRNPKTGECVPNPKSKAAGVQGPKTPAKKATKTPAKKGGAKKARQPKVRSPEQLAKLLAKPCKNEQKVRRSTDGHCVFVHSIHKQREAAGVCDPIIKFRADGTKHHIYRITNPFFGSESVLLNARGNPKPVRRCLKAGGRAAQIAVISNNAGYAHTITKKEFPAEYKKAILPILSDPAKKIKFMQEHSKELCDPMTHTYKVYDIEAGRKMYTQGQKKGAKPKAIAQGFQVGRCVQDIKRSELHKVNRRGNRTNLPEADTYLASAFEHKSVNPKRAKAYKARAEAAKAAYAAEKTPAKKTPAKKATKGGAKKATKGGAKKGGRKASTV